MIIVVLVTRLWVLSYAIIRHWKRREDQEFNFGHSKYGMSIRYPNKEFK